MSDQKRDFTAWREVEQVVERAVLAIMSSEELRESAARFGWNRERTEARLVWWNPALVCCTLDIYLEESHELPLPHVAEVSLSGMYVAENDSIVQKNSQSVEMFSVTGYGLLELLQAWAIEANRWTPQAVRDDAVLTHLASQGN